MAKGGGGGGRRSWMKGERTWTYVTTPSRGRFAGQRRWIVNVGGGEARTFGSAKEARKYVRRVESGEIRRGQAPKLTVRQQQWSTYQRRYGG